jgi:hypothetical protein
MCKPRGGRNRSEASAVGTAGHVERPQREARRKKVGPKFFLVAPVLDTDEDVVLWVSGLGRIIDAMSDTRRREFEGAVAIVKGATSGAKSK